MEAVRGNPGLPQEVLESLRAQVVSDIEAKFCHKDERLLQHGQAEIGRLRSEQQQINSSIGQLKESQEQLVLENQKLRNALLEVTCKFEIVVKEMREALRAMPHRGYSQHSPAPSVASTSASELAGNMKLPTELTPASGVGGAELNASWSVEQSCWLTPTPVIPGWAMPEAMGVDGLDAGGSGADVFRTPPKVGTSGRAERVFVATPGASDSAASHAVLGSPAVLSLASVLPTAQKAALGLKRLQLAECLPRDSASLDTPEESGAGAAATLPEQPSPDDSPGAEAGAVAGAAATASDEGRDADAGASWREVEMVKEDGFVTLGMEVNAADRCLLVESIDEHGLASRHNLQQASAAFRVHVGDRIVEVNGVSGDPSRMLEECKTRQRVLFRIAGGGDERVAPNSGKACKERQAEVGVTSSAEEPANQMRPDAEIFVPLARSEASPVIPPDHGVPPGLHPGALLETGWSTPASLLTAATQAMFVPQELSPHLLACSMVELAVAGGCEPDETRRTLFP